MGKLSKSELVAKLARKAFAECDVDDDGSIDAKELHLGLMIVFDKLNKALPVYLKPPSHDTVQGMLKKYDADGSGKLNFDEFHACVRTMVGVNENAKFTDSLPFAIVSKMALKMVLFPLAALAIKTVMMEAGSEGTKKVAKKIPNSALAFGVEGLYKLGCVALQR